MSFKINFKTIVQHKINNSRDSTSSFIKITYFFKFEILFFKINNEFEFVDNYVSKTRKKNFDLLNVDDIIFYVIRIVVKKSQHKQKK